MTDPESFNYYDCFPINDRTLYSQRLFGNGNIGNARLCNLQMPGIGSVVRDAILEGKHRG